MRARVVVLPVVAVIAATLATVVPATARPASVDCTYNPKLPKQIVVNRAPTVFHTPVSIVGTDCSDNFSASVSLAHRGDTYELSWQYNHRTSSDSIYPITVKPGTYKTANDAQCSTTGSDGTTKSCAVGDGSTVIKFGGKAHLSADRLKGSDHDKVQFTVKATRYAQYKTVYLSTKVYLQRKHSGTWHTIHSDTTAGKHGYTWTYRRAKSGSYRALFRTTSTTFGATSKTVKQ